MSAVKKSISLNVARQLWAQSGGYCQNPRCNKLLFREIGDEVVSLANVAHIISSGSKGPRSDHELASYIDKNGMANLLMLCLECHKVVDELEKKFSVEEMSRWKATHASRISSLFAIPNIKDESQLLAEVNDLLDLNGAVYRECGPYSDNVLNGNGGDGLKIWRKRCLDTVLPNNQRIVGLIENNKRNYQYPWDLYAQMLQYKIHAEAFQDNCLTDQKINDYKLFPKSFDHFVKTKLGITTPTPEVATGEELEFRHNQIKTFIDRFLLDHRSIANLQELNRGTMIVELRDGRTLKVFVTNTYVFTSYTLDRVLEVDPAVNAIICSCPAGQYSNEVKQRCIDEGLGLFMLGEFMGAINFSGEKYLNFLLKADLEARISNLKRLAEKSLPPAKVSVFAFGSFLRRRVYKDVDLMIVYQDASRAADLKGFEERLSQLVEKSIGAADITVASSGEFRLIKLEHDNLSQVYP